MKPRRSMLFLVSAIVFCVTVINSAQSQQASSSTVKLGDKVIVIPNPEGFEEASSQSEDEINDRNWQTNSKIVAIRKSSIRTPPKSGMARSKLSTEFVRRAGSVDFELRATQRGTSDGTSIIRRGKIHPGTIITTSTMPVDCVLC